MIYKRKPPPGNVRRVRHINKNIHGITTNKCGRLVQFESEQERKLILLLERDATVTDFISQPETLTFVAENGRNRQYTPDFQVWRTNGQIELHEVTITQRRQRKETIQQRETAARHICQRRGWTYHVHTEETLPVGYKYANLDALAPFRADTYANDEMAAWWLVQLTGRDPVHPQIILSDTPPAYANGILLNTLYHLIWHDQVQIEWNAPLMWRGAFHPNTRIWLIAKAAQVLGTSAKPILEVQR